MSTRFADWADMRPPSAHKQRAGYVWPLLAGLAYFFAWYLLTVDGLWGYAQHLALKKKYIPSSIFVLGMVGLLLLFRKQKGQDKVVFPLTFAWACWMLVVLLTASNVNLSSPFRIAFGFYVNYWHFIAAALALNTSFKIDEKLLIRLLLWTALPVVALGVAQGVLQDNFGIGNWIAQEASAFNLGFFGRRRANSAFAHAEDLGFYAAIIMCVAFAYWLRPATFSSKVFLSGIIVLGAGATFFTFTRATYLVAASGLAATLFIHRLQKSGKPAPYWLPAAFLVVGILIYFSAPLIQLLSSSGTLFSSASLGERHYGNRYYMGEMQRQGWHSFVTGLGWFVNGHYKAVFAIDNQYVALVLSTGLVGLFFWITITSVLWRRLLSRAMTSGSPALIGFAGVCSTWLMQSMFNVTGTIAFVCLLAFVIPERHADEKPA